MLDTVSSLELHYLVEEMQKLISGKVDKIWQPKKKEIDIRLHVPSTGKIILRIALPGLIYLSEQKQEYPQTPHGYTMFLRRRISSARVREIYQYKSERIVVVLFETKDAKFYMVVELFSKGNVILCDENWLILSPLEQQRWANREVRARIKYEFPDKGVNSFDVDLEGFKANLKPKKTLVKSLAIDFGIGGVFAEEVCRRAGADKNATEVNDFDSLFKAFSEVVHHKASPVVIKEGDVVKNILPFPLEGGENAQSFMEALDAYHSQHRTTAIEEEDEKTERAAVSKVEKILQMQEKQAKQLEKKIADSTKRGELIYHHLQDIKKLFAAIEEMKEKKEWAEIREELMKVPAVLDVDLKEKRITLELKE